MNESPKYFNFPVELLAGFMDDSKAVLSNVCDYSIYEHFLKLCEGTVDERMSSACHYFGITLSNSTKSRSNGRMLYDSIDRNSPKVGISLSIFWDYYNNNKDPFEKACLLAFLALKSIIQNKPYCKLENRFLWARMDGYRYSIDEISQLSDSIKPFAKEYQTVKIKNALRDGWGLVTYSRYTRGFYISFTLTLDQLVYEAEKRRKSTREKQNKAAERAAIEKAMKRLDSS